VSGSWCDLRAIPTRFEGAVHATGEFAADGLFPLTLRTEPRTGHRIHPPTAASPTGPTADAAAGTRRPAGPSADAHTPHPPPTWSTYRSRRSACPATHRPSPGH